MKINAMAIAGVLALAGFCVPASAQTYDPDRLKDSVTRADLLAIVAALDHKVRDGIDGPFVVAADAPGGEAYTLLGRACGSASCKGLSITIAYRQPITVTPEMINKMNIFRPAFTTASNTGVLSFSRYLILDEGVTMANITANIKVLLGAAPTLLAVAKGEQGL